MSRRAGLSSLVVIAFLAGCASSGAPVASGVEDVIPGEPVIQLLGEAESYELAADRAFALDGAPAEATHVRVTVQCTSPGTTSFGTDPGGNNPSLTCSAEDVATSADTAWMDIEFGPGDELVVSFSPGATSIITMQYAGHTPTEWGVNAHGETYGSIGDGSDPDLIAASGIAPDGSTVEGYVRSEDLMPQPMPTSPEEALEQQAEWEALHPDGFFDVPLYESDGRTVIGTFRVAT